MIETINIFVHVVVDRCLKLLMKATKDTLSSL